ncbi:MAG: TlpA disulfide reductase family protein [Myxococcota bacterium]
MKRAIALALLGAMGCASTPSTPESAQLPIGPAAVQLITMDGKSFSLSALRGEAALITVIQTWADYAMVEIPLLNQVAERYGDRVTVLCIALDEQPEMVRIFIDTFKPAYEVVRIGAADRQRFTTERGPFGPITLIPTSVLLDADGQVAARMDGTWRPDVLRDALQALVGPPSQ